MSKEQHLSLEVNKVPEGRLGMWVLIAGELVIFGGLIATYLLYRLRYPHWSEMAAHTSTLIGAINTVVLLCSSFAIVKAHEAAQKLDVAKATRWISFTILGGLMFLVDKTIEYTHEIEHGFTFTSPKLQQAGDHVGSLFWSFYYIMTGLHSLHVIAGMIVMIIILFQIRKGKNLHRVELAGMYWHMVDLIWIFLFPLLYIAK
ncbi:MAG TPA: cytochrome c oxidase subunit 3 [Bacteroidia bacterium]|jgi:heme/copper-type cytochrome/quinol oxidase subunit 3|nr:cytochrome c oxidase subunit 3 [Bacteroidia bacterium]